MKKGKKACILLLLIGLCSFGPALSVCATSTSGEIENEVEEENSSAFPNTSPWLKDTQDNSIYENAVDASEEDQDIKVKKPGRVEKYIAELFRNIGSGVISLLQENIGISLDRIIYGRVGSGQPNRVNIFAFEIRKGNPYGVSGAVCYALIRGMAFAFLGIQFTAILAKSAWTGQTAKSREEIKTVFPAMILKFAALMLMPYLLDVALYVRDVVLYGIKDVTGQMITGGATLSMSKAFLANAERSGTFVDALMYLGTVALTIYFMFLYVALAMDMLICFVAFPVLCLFHSRKRDLLSGWIMTVFSNIITPMIDAMLLLIPLLTSLMLSDTIRGVSIIQLIMCLLIIPARSRMKSLLGVQSNERNGFLGAMAMMALARAAVGGVKRGFGKVGEVFDDAKKSRTQGELAEIDREEEDYLTGNVGKPDKRNRGEEIAGHAVGEPGTGILSQSSKESSALDEESGRFKSEELTETGTLAGSNSFSELMEVQAETDGFTGEGIVKPAEDEPLPLLSGDAPVLEGESGRGRNDILRDLEMENNQLQGAMDTERVERAGAMKEDKRLKREMLDHDRGTDEYKALEREKADNESRVASLDEQIAGQNRRINAIRRQKETLSVGNNTKKVPTTFDERRIQVAAKRADISNFDAPEFKNVLSPAQMQSLYRKRAVVNAGKLAAGLGCSLGAGAALGGSAVFLGPSATALATAGGIEIGGVAGEAAVDGAVSIGQTAGRAFRTATSLTSQVSTEAVLRRIGPAASSVPVSWDTVPVLERAPEREEGGEVLQPELPQQQIQADTSLAFSKVLDLDGNMKNSSALRALKEANVGVEKYIASMKEENAQILTREMELEKRISAQTEALAQEVMRQMETGYGYQRGTPAHEAAKEILLGKIREVMEKNNRLL